MANELDFSGKQVLVAGGSSGIGNGIAQAFRARGVQVAVCGTRARPTDYSAEDGSDLTGLAYAQLDVSNAGAIEAFRPSFDRLDILVLAQGAVIMLSSTAAYHSTMGNPAYNASKTGAVGLTRRMASASTASHPVSSTPR